MPTGTARILPLAWVFACIAISPVRADSTILHANAVIHPDSAVSSPSGHVVFSNRGGGALSLFVNGEPVWTTQGAPGADRGIAIMQGDGDFVAYDGNMVPCWHTGTQEHDGAYLAVQDDGQIVVYSREGSPLWSAPEPML